MSSLAQKVPLTRHDLLLAVIAVSLAVGGLVAVTSGVSLAHAMAAGSVPAGAGLGYALFYRPPVETGE